MSLRASYQKIPNITLGRKPKPKLKVVKPLPEHRPGMYLTRSDAAMINNIKAFLDRASNAPTERVAKLEMSEAYRLLRSLNVKHSQ